VQHTDPELLALRALGENAGGTEADAHILGCPVCRAEISRLAEVTAIARGDGSPALLQEPPAGLWDRIAAEVGDPSQLPPRQAGRMAAGTAAWPGEDERGQEIAGRRSGSRHRMRLRLAVAAAAGIVIGAGAAVGADQLASSPVPAAGAIAQVSLRPLPQFPQWRGASGTAVLRSSTAKLALDVSLRAPDRSGFYEVWLLGRDGVSMISLGDLPAAHTGTFSVPPGTDLRFYSRIDVSLQPFNGSPVHSKASVVRGSLPVTISGTPS
jgi:Anti-sigma-K factor rskA